MVVKLFGRFLVVIVVCAMILQWVSSALVSARVWLVLTMGSCDYWFDVVIGSVEWAG